MEYTILELERIEKVLREKLSAASYKYSRREGVARQNFRAEQIERNGRRSDIVFSGDAVGYVGEPVSGTLSKAWKDLQLEDMELVFLKEEMDLFQEGVDTIHDHWNSSVETFIKNLREQTKAVVVIDSTWGKLEVALAKSRQEGGIWTIKDIPQIVKNHCEDHMDEQNMKMLTMNILAALKKLT